MTQSDAASLSIESLCDHLGRREIAARVARTPAAVSNAVADGRFPATWYLAIRAMCEEVGIACPVGLFNFTPSLPQSSPSPPKTNPDGNAPAEPPTEKDAAA